LSAPAPTASSPPPPPPPPPTLTSVSVTPTSPSVQVGATLQFRVSGTMSDGSTASPTSNWTATGGTINSSGLYTAGSVAGTYQVTAIEPNSGLSALTSVTVTAAPPPPPAGSTFQTGFANYTAGATPSGWTATSAPYNVSWLVVANATAADGFVLRNTTTVTARHILRWDTIPDTTTTQEVLVRMRLDNDDDRGPGVALRHTMSPGGAETAYVAYLRSSSDQLEINAFLAGGWQFIGAASFVNDPGQWYWMRFRADGNTLRVRVWADGAAEP